MTRTLWSVAKDGKLAIDVTMYDSKEIIVTITDDEWFGQGQLYFKGTLAELKDKVMGKPFAERISALEAVPCG